LTRDATPGRLRIGENDPKKNCGEQTRFAETHGGARTLSAVEVVSRNPLIPEKRMFRFTTVFAGAAYALAAATALARDVDPGRVRAAVERALPPIQLGLKTFSEKKPMPNPEVLATLPEAYRKVGCLSCHHEGVGLSTLGFLRKKGFGVDDDLAARLASSLTRGYVEFAPLYRRALTDEAAARAADFFGDIPVQMGYLLGGLLDSGYEPNPTTSAAAELLLKFQQEDGSWTFEFPREPLQSSDFTTTAMAARVLRVYAPKRQADRADRAIARARQWLLDDAPSSTDDLAFRLLGLCWLRAPPNAVREAVRPLLSAQRPNGGWTQLPSTTESDAYATGLVLLALNQSGCVPVDDPAYRRGVAFLLETQRPDGTWFVRKWAHEYNKYFDAGFPTEVASSSPCQRPVTPRWP
jgi:hypothetical protein